MVRDPTAASLQRGALDIGWANWPAMLPVPSTPHRKGALTVVNSCRPPLTRSLYADKIQLATAQIPATLYAPGATLRHSKGSHDRLAEVTWKRVCRRSRADYRRRGFHRLASCRGTERPARQHRRAR